MFLGAAVKVSADHEVGPFATADLIVDDALHGPRVLCVIDIRGHFRDHCVLLGEQTQCRFPIKSFHPVDDQAAQGLIAGQRFQTALSHLVEGDQSDDLTALQRDIGQAININDLAGEDIHVWLCVPVDEDEGLRIGRSEQFGQQGGSHRVSLGSGRWRPRPHRHKKDRRSGGLR
ncbi:MAG TPA: hypothetical protein VK086_08185 [Ruania sp.]|nr:hypothetical protein [Ruania sp.]